MGKELLQLLGALAFVMDETSAPTGGASEREEEPWGYQERETKFPTSSFHQWMDLGNWKSGNTGGGGSV